MTNRVWQKTLEILWALLVIALPFTSLPLVMKLTGSSSVAPASLLFVIPLVLLYFPVLLKKDQPLPFHVRPVLLFFLFALLTIPLAVLTPVPDFKQQSITRAGLEGAVTLGLGLLFYLAAVSLPNSVRRINLTLQLLNWTGLALVVYSILQVTLEMVIPSAKPGLNAFHALLSPTRLLEDRMQGFAAEPSWLAHMLNLVFLAYWLAATLNRTSAHRFRILRMSLENILLVLGVVALVGTLSRGGLAAFMLVLGFVFALLNIRLARWLSTRFGKGRRAVVTAVITLLLIVMYAIIALAGLWGLSRVDPRMEMVFQFTQGESNPLLEYAENLKFGERVIYWQTGWNIFNDHPLMGVGVGFSGFYFPQYLPDFGWQLSETRELLFRSDGLLNIKNLWTRLLAETGIIGFALFITFLVVFAITAVEMINSGRGMRRTLGFMGLFMLVALLVEQMSVDSFAMPYLWFSMGLVTAGWRWYLPVANNGGVNGQI